MGEKANLVIVEGGWVVFEAFLEIRHEVDEHYAGLQSIPII